MVWFIFQSQLHLLAGFACYHPEDNADFAALDFLNM
jgi:hypothetical protein